MFYPLNKNTRYYVALTLVGCLYLLFAWNTTPTLTDDLLYEFKFNMEGDYSHPVPIRSMGDIIDSLSAIYLTINGRLTTQFLTHFFVSLVPKHVLDAVNTIMFVLLIHLSICFLRLEKNRIITVGLMVSLMFLAIIGFQSSMVWSCGTFSYLWVLVPTLAFLLFLRRCGSCQLRWYYWIACLPAILVGWSHEGLALPLSLGFIIFAFYHPSPISHHLSFPLMFYYAVGGALCLSPAVWQRAGNDVSIVHRLMSGCVVIFLQSRILWFLILTVIVLWIKDRQFLIKSFKDNLFLWIACLLCYAIAFACGEATVRVNFFGEFLGLLLLLSLFAWFKDSFSRSASVVLSVLALLVYVQALYCCRLQVGDYEYAVGQMETPGRTLIHTHITLPEGRLMNVIYNTYVVPFASYGYYQVYMGFDAADSNMRCAAVKYNKPSMIFLPDRLANEIEGNKLKTSCFTLDNADNLYAIRLADGRKVNKVVFHLKKEDPRSLQFWQRPLAYKGDTFELDDFHWQVINVSGQRVLVITKPLTNVFRRIKSIEVL